MGFEIGDIVKKKDGDQKMTVLRFVGDEENDAMGMMDHQLSSKGFQSGSPMCEWFEGTTVKTGTFHARDLEKVALAKPVKEETPEEATEEAGSSESTEEEDFNFDDEDFDF